MLILKFHKKETSWHLNYFQLCNLNYRLIVHDISTNNRSLLYTVYTYSIQSPDFLKSREKMKLCISIKMLNFNWEKCELYCYPLQNSVLPSSKYVGCTIFRKYLNSNLCLTNEIQLKKLSPNFHHPPINQFLAIFS